MRIGQFLFGITFKSQERNEGILCSWEVHFQSFIFNVISTYGCASMSNINKLSFLPHVYLQNCSKKHFQKLGYLQRKTRCKKQSMSGRQRHRSSTGGRSTSRSGSFRSRSSAFRSRSSSRHPSGSSTSELGCNPVNYEDGLGSPQTPMTPDTPSSSGEWAPATPSSSQSSSELTAVEDDNVKRWAVPPTYFKFVHMKGSSYVYECVECEENNENNENVKVQSTISVTQRTRFNLRKHMNVNITYLLSLLIFKKILIFVVLSVLSIDTRN